METTDGSTTVRGSSRRDFLKGAAVSAAGIVGASLLSACAAKTDSSSTAVAATETAASTSGNVAGYCGPGDWLGEAPAIADADITSDETYDVVIFGSGHSGVGAAMAAADKGLKVAVVEKQAWSAFVDLEGTGDNMAGWYGEDIGHVNSQFLIDRGFGPYNTGEIALEFCKRGGNGRVNPDIIKAFIQNSGAMFDRYHEIYNTYEAERKANDSNVFMKGTMVVIDGEPVPDEGNFDMSNMFEYPLCNTQAAYAVDSYPINSGGYKTWPCNAQFYGYQGNNIEYIHKYIVQYAQENGATYYFEHTGIKLVQDESGAVTGLIAQNAEGKYIKLNATKGVILCSGDFIGNPAMCWALLNEGMEWGSRGGSTAEDWATAGTRDGIGHKMGVWAGGMIEPTPRGWMSLGGGPSGPWGAAPLLQLNVEGKRFYNEAAIPQAGNVTLRQPAGLACYVTDANWEKTVCSAPLDHGSPNFGMPDYYNLLKAQMDAVVPGPESTVITGTFLAERKMMKGNIFAANTLDELAGYLGYEGAAKESFLASIAHYNEMCASPDGDVDYGKDAAYMVPIDTPPFYGGASELSHTSRPMMVTMSGLMTDATQNVLKTDWTPIPGLYAAGNCLGGRYGTGYSTPFAGNSVGMAMTHGWTAANNIAAL